MTFSGHDLEFKLLDGEVYIKCKHITGTYSEILAFKNKTNPTGVYYFGEALSKQRAGKFIQVGCLLDSLAKVDEIIKECEKIKNNQDEQSKI